MKDKKGIKVVSGEGKKNLPGRERFASIVILVVLFLIFLQVGYQWVNSWLYFRRVQIAVAETGSVDLTMNVQGIITRHEKVVHSPHTGTVLGRIPEGDRVSVGGEVMTIYPHELAEPVDHDEDINVIIYYYELIKDWLRDIFFLDGDFDRDESGEFNNHLSRQGEALPVKSPQAGIVSYAIDGLEGNYLPDYPYDLLERIIRAGDETTAEEVAVESNFVSEGEPLFKIVDNWEWFLSIAVDYEKGEELRNRNNISLTFSFLPDEIIDAYMVDFQTDRESELAFVTYRFGRQIPGFSRHRRVEVELNYNTHEGIMVPKSSIVYSEEEPGVYLNERGRVVFYPLEIIYEDDDRVIVDGISPQSIIITRPDLVTEGQRLE